MKISRVLKAVLFVLICELIGISGSFSTVSSIPTWYAHLNKPFFNPPNFLFGPVWTILYALMGISFFLVWEKRTKKNPYLKAMFTFLVQLFLNAIWSPIFFGYKNLGLGAIVIVLLLLMIIRTVSEFAKVNKVSSYLLYPYLAWVSFATILNISIWFLN
jgi:translocator protein